jgi:hypothetical protein
MWGRGHQASSSSQCTHQGKSPAPFHNSDEFGATLPGGPAARRLKLGSTAAARAATPPGTDRAGPHKATSSLRTEFRRTARGMRPSDWFSAWLSLTESPSRGWTGKGPGR